MKSFQFRLESVLRFRKTELEIQRAKLQKLVSENRALQEHISRLSRDRIAARVFIQSLDDAGPGDFRALSSFVLGTSMRLTTLHEELARLSKLIRDQIAAVQQAERNMKILEKLKEKKLYEWRREIDKEVEAVAYEAWLAAHGRSNKQHAS